MIQILLSLGILYTYATYTTFYLRTENNEKQEADQIFSRCLVFTNYAISLPAYHSANGRIVKVKPHPSLVLLFEIQYLRGYARMTACHGIDRIVIGSIVATGNLNT